LIGKSIAFGLRLRKNDEQTTRSRFEVLFQGNAVMEEAGLMMVKIVHARPEVNRGRAAAGLTNND
jgi:hypothetical protein